MDEDELRRLPGGIELCAWFGGVPSFHDAKLLDLQVHQGRESMLKVRTWKMRNEANDEGFYVLENHVVVRFVLDELVAVELYEFMEQGILHGIEINHTPDSTKLSFDASYGVHGHLEARHVKIDFQPEPPPQPV